MLRLPIFIFFLCLFQFNCLHTYAQQRNDTVIIAATKDADTTGKNILSADTSLKKHNPHKATFRSAVLPGWGQAYNKKYWKIPIVYAALGTTAAVFLYNLKTYKELKQAYIYTADTISANNILIKPQYRSLSPESIRSYRNSFRQNVDYSVLVFMIFWALNVVDATVDAHLKSFNVSDDITLKLKPHFNLNSTGIGLVFSFKDNHSKTLSSLH